MYTSKREGVIIDLMEYKQRRSRKVTRSTAMTTIQLESLITTIRQLIQKARSSNDSCEYYRLCEELRFAEAALNARPALTSSSALAFI